MDPETLRTLAKGFLSSLGEAKDSGGIIVRRPVIVRADSIDEKARTVRVVASSDSIDSYGDIVKQNFRLDRYKKNPVVLYGHNRVGVFGMGGAPEWSLPVGFSTDFGVGADGLETTLNFVDKKASPMADYCWEGFRQQSIRAVSIGFFPHLVEESEDPESGDTLYTLDDNELFEISVVPIGANPDAVALAHQRSLERAFFKQRAVGTKTISVPPPSPAPAPDPTPKTHAAPAAQESHMTLTPEEIKKLQDDLAAKTAEVKVLNDQLATAKASLEQANTKLAADTLRANTAEASLKAKADTEADQAIDAEVQKLVGVKITQDQKAAYIELRKASPAIYENMVKGLADLPAASSAEIEKDVDALVGKKINPAQKAEFVELRKANPELFAKIASGMPDLASTKRFTPSEKNPTENKSGKTGGTSKIAKGAAKAAEKARTEASS